MLPHTFPGVLILLLSITVQGAEDPSPSAAIANANRLQSHHYFDSAGFKLFIEAMRLDPNYLQLTLKGRTLTLKGVFKKIKPFRYVSQDFEVPKDHKVNLGDIRANFTSGVIMVTAPKETDEVVRDVKIEGVNAKSGREMNMLFKKIAYTYPAQKKLKTINLIG